MSNVHTAFLAFDLGAETGRAFLGKLQGGRIELREIHRFPNQPIEYDGVPHWDAARLWHEIRSALCAVEEPTLAAIGVDAWGVDYALLDERGELLDNPRHYRDHRNIAAMNELLQLIPREEIYRTTGIQFMPINTLNQLFAANREKRCLLAGAERLIMIPDLFHYWMTGTAVCEFTAASTTQLVDARTRNWARDLMSRLLLPHTLPGPIVEPGSVIGKLRTGLARASSLDGTSVITPASHDTASAVAAVTARDETAFLSSGTWSLVGIELDAPIVSEEALRLNFTNEGGVCGTTRFLKNVMGLWMLQGCRRSFAAQGREYTYPEIMAAATEAPAFRHLVDPDDVSFLNPDDMLSAIDRFCLRSDQASPASPGAYARTVLESLALKYRLVIRDLETVTDQRIARIRIIGGGSRNQLLNQFTADATGRRVLAGPMEAAVLGNIGVQIMATGGAAGLAEVRAVIDRSFRTEIFEPSDTATWEQVAERFQQYCDSTYA